MGVGRGVAAWVLLVIVSAIWAKAAGPIIVPRAAQSPVLDGKLDDACWQSALVLTDFTVPDRAEKPAKPVEARLCFDDSALYVAVTCAEPQLDKITAKVTERGNQVWSDDCIELWLRGTANASDSDQFVVNPIGTQEELRHRDAKRVDYKPTWQVKAQKTDRAWVAEFKIPAADVDLGTLRRGDAIGLKVGRQDRAGDGTRVSVWPAEAPYGAEDGYATVYLQTANLLVSTDLKDPTRWGITDQTAKYFSAAVEGGAPVIRVQSPADERWTLNQTLKLRPNSRYRFAGDIKATGPMLVRFRVPQGNNSDDRIDTAVPASADYVGQTVSFTTGAEGAASLVFSGTSAGKPGEYSIKNPLLMRVALDEPTSVGPGILVKAGAEPLWVSKLKITDCRQVRGFITNPVDGTVRSAAWDGRLWEYNQASNYAAIHYAYRRNDGLHLTLGDDQGFNAVVVRGGIKAAMVGDAANYDDPKSGKLVHEFKGLAQDSRAWFDQPVKANKISFFDATDGVIADCSFFRTGAMPADLKPGLRMRVVSTQNPVPTALVENHLNVRFAPPDRTIYRVDGQASPYKSEPFAVPAGNWVHLISEPLTQEHAAGAMGIDMEVAAEGKSIPFTLRIQDPLNPRLELHGADYTLDAAGRVRVSCDFADQVIPAGRALWVAVRFDQAVTLNNVKVDLYTVPRAQAVAEALEYRKFLLRGFYVPMSEARPWNGFSRQSDIDKYVGTGQHADAFYKILAPWTGEILETLDQCRALDPEGKDDVVRQYYQWIYRNILRRSPEGLPPYPTRFDKIDGVPEWATLAHQAWMQARAVPKWWIDNRMTPNGELGGEVGDDSDLYANLAPFPFFERDGVAGEMLDAAARLAELAEAEHLEGGLNRNATDPLHAYEEGLNHLAFMSAWNYGDPVYFERCMVSGANVAKFLTIKTPNGHRHFKNGLEGSADMRIEREITAEGGAHFLMWHPAFVAASYSRNPQLMQYLKEWGDGWLEHQQPGKFAGGVALPQDEPKDFAEQPFPALYGFQGCAFVFLSDLTGDAKYVKPYTDYWTTGKIDAGVQHIPEVLQLGLLPDAAKSKAVIERQWNGPLYATGDKKPFIDAIKKDIEELQRFGHMYTTVECFTDRVFLYPAINPAIAYTGGYTTRNKLNHNYAVSWEGFGTDYAALVTTATNDRLKVLVCNVSDKPLAGSARIWRLEHGDYQVTVGPDADGDDKADKLDVDQTRPITRGDGVALKLAPKAVVVLEIRQTKKLEPIYDRSDLALSKLELKVEAGKVSARVHNIGNRDVADVVVAIVDAGGKELARKPLGKLAAPLDLVPKAVAVEFTGLPADLAGCSIVADPDNKEPEIYEGNNRLPLNAPAAAARATP